MKILKLNKVICCSFDLTLATRIIGFIGLAISATLVTTLSNDKVINDYSVSRNVALALGLDWSHFHQRANATYHADAEGKIISILVIFYSVLYTITNLLLLFAATLNKRALAIPWLACEFLGCLSKFGAMIYHLVTEPQKVNNIFLIGSCIYIVIVTWWWLVVFEAQYEWRCKKTIILHLSTPSDKLSNVPLECNSEFQHSFKGEYVHLDSFESPNAYIPNVNYRNI